ncbi:MAG: DUF6733 family protein [Chloroherpetonaceae bacterium]
MKHKHYFNIIFILIFSSLTLEAQQKVEEKSDKFIVDLNLDPIFGFYPEIYIYHSLSKNIDLNFYTTFWVSGIKDDSSEIASEFGIGLDFKFFSSDLVLTPSIGIGSGNFQSGGGRLVVGDNIVPSLTVDIELFDKIHVEGMGIYWKSLRKESNKRVYLDQMEWMANAEYSVSDLLDFGIYMDQYLIKEFTNNWSDLYSVFLWLGPSLKVKVRNNYLWFSAGVDLIDYLDKTLPSNKKTFKDYYKLTANFEL